MLHLIATTLFSKVKQNPEETQLADSRLAWSPFELWGLLLFYSSLNSNSQSVCKKINLNSGMGE